MTDTYGKEVDSEQVTNGEYRGYEYEVIRTNHPKHTNGTGFEYEFVLKVGGITRATAGELEVESYENPWPTTLERYAKAFIDGAKSGL